MSNNKSKTSLIDLNKKSGVNALKNKARFAKTIAIDPRKKEITPTTPVNDITDLSIAIDPILDEDVSDVLDIADVSDTTENGSKIDIID